MPVHSSWSLQKGIHQVLSDSLTLNAHLNGPNIFDHTPKDQAPPYVVFAELTTGELSENLHEHRLVFHIWSDGEGRKILNEIAQEIKNTLHDQILPLEDHTLINLRHISTETLRNKKNHLYQGILRYRAVTEAQ